MWICISKYWFTLFCCEAIFVANLNIFLAYLLTNMVAYQKLQIWGMWIWHPVPFITTLYPLWAGTLVIALNHKVKFEKYFSSPAEPLLAYLVIYIFLWTTPTEPQGGLLISLNWKSFLKILLFIPSFHLYDSLCSSHSRKAQKFLAVIFWYIYLNGLTSNQWYWRSYLLQGMLSNLKQAHKPRRYTS